MSKKMLIVFYSWSNGNTERVSRILQKATGADMVKIETVVPYTGSYNDVVQQGQEDCASAVTSRRSNRWILIFGTMV